MTERIITIHHAVGLHARPASIFVQEAVKFASEITVTYGELTTNAKSILGILSLGVQQGAEIKIAANGEDAEQAVAALVALIENNFGE